jgi:hypothetical protein
LELSVLEESALRARWRSLRGAAREVVIVDRTRARAKAVATDCATARRFVPRSRCAMVITQTFPAPPSC